MVKPIDRALGNVVLAGGLLAIVMDAWRVNAQLPSWFYFAAGAVIGAAVTTWTERRWPVRE